MAPPTPVNGIVETSIYVRSAARAAEFYRRVLGFEIIAVTGDILDDDTRLCAMRAGDRDVLLLFKRGATHDTDAAGAIHVAFAIGRADLARWEAWLIEQGVAIESRDTFEYGGQSVYFRDPDGHLLELVTPGVWTIY